MRSLTPTDPNPESAIRLILGELKVTRDRRNALFNRVSSDNAEIERLDRLIAAYVTALQAVEAEVPKVAESEMDVRS